MVTVIPLTKQPIVGLSIFGISHAINRPGANVRKGSDEGPAVKKTWRWRPHMLGISIALFSWQVVVLLGYSYRACDSFSAEELGSRVRDVSSPLHYKLKR